MEHLHALRACPTCISPTADAQISLGAGNNYADGAAAREGGPAKQVIPNRIQGHDVGATARYGSLRSLRATHTHRTNAACRTPSSSTTTRIAAEAWPSWSPTKASRPPAQVPCRRRAICWHAARRDPARPGVARRQRHRVLARGNDARSDTQVVVITGHASLESRSRRCGTGLPTTC